MQRFVPYWYQTIVFYHETFQKYVTFGYKYQLIDCKVPVQVDFTHRKSLNV